MQYFPNQYDDNVNDTMTLETALEIVENREEGIGVDYDADLPFEIAALNAALDAQE